MSQRTADTRLATASWMLLLASLATALLTDSPDWFGLSHPVFQSGAGLFQAYAAQLLVMGALACFAASLMARPRSVRWHPAMLIALGLLGWTAVTTALSPSPASAIVGMPINSQGLVMRTVATAALMLTVWLADGPGRIRVAARTIAAVGGVSALVGVLQWAGMDPLGGRAVWGSGRAFGTLGNPDMFGGFIVFALFTALGVALSEKRGVWRGLMLASAAACAAGDIMSYSRAAWVGTVAGAVAFALLARRSRPRVDRKSVIALACVALAVVGAVGLRPARQGSLQDVAHRLTSAVSPTDRDTAGRLEVWAIALRAIARRPLQGYGPDTMVLATEPFRTARFARMSEPSSAIESAHNLALQTMTESGIPGFLLWAGMLAVVAVASAKVTARPSDGSARLGLVLTGLWSACAAYLADSLFTPSTATGVLLFSVGLGLLLSPSAARRSAGGAPVLRVVASATVLVALAGSVLAAPLAAADMWAAIARDPSIPGVRRVEAGARAASANPLSADYAVANGGALSDQAEALGRAGADRSQVRASFDAALAEGRRAVALQPTNQRRRSFLAGVMLVGSLYVDKSWGPAALAESRTAVSMSPNDLQTRYEYARALPSDRARPMLQAILRVRPGYAAAASTLATMLARDGRAVEARAVLDAAIRASVSRTDIERLEALGESLP